eukprot:scaffold63407_cov63-Phaeocystis_antarctica.AAC.4
MLKGHRARFGRFEVGQARRLAVHRMETERLHMAWSRRLARGIQVRSCQRGLARRDLGQRHTARNVARDAVVLSLLPFRPEPCGLWSPCP